MSSVGSSLRRLRISAALTQEELAERAGISARSVSDIERDLRTRLYPDTARRIADALNLDQAERSEFLDRARRRPRPNPDSHRLPAPFSPIIGRDAEIRAVVDAFATRRLVTITGIGGIGKTRLALAACEELLPAFDARIGFVAFTAGDGPDRFLSEVAAAVGALPGGRVEAIRTAVGRRRFLLVLDAFEHVMTAVPLLEALLTSSASIAILVTSRVRLNLTGEDELHLGPLDGPSAVELFRDRAPNLRATDSPMLAEICHLVDGHPLAVELTAARARHLPLGVVHAELTRGTAGVNPRLDDAIQTSIDAVSEAALSLLAAAAMFPAGWRMEALRTLIGVDPVAALGELSDRGLVRVSSDDSDARWRMFDIVRERVLEGRAASAAEQAAYVALHVALVQELGAQLGAEAGWHAAIRAEEANLETALAWATELGDSAAVLNLASGVWQYWQSIGRFAHARRWIETGLSIDGTSPIGLVADAHWALAWLALHQGDGERLRAAVETLHELARTTTDPGIRRNAETVRGILASWDGHQRDAAVHMTAALGLARTIPRPWILGASLLNAGWAELAVGNLDASQELLLEAIRLFDRIGDRRFHARSLANLGVVVLERHDVLRAEALFRQSLAAFARLREPGGTAEGLDCVAAVAADRGDALRAATLAGAAERLRELYGARPLRLEGHAIGRRLDAVQRLVTPEAWASAWSDGRALDRDRAVALGLS